MKKVKQRKKAFEDYYKSLDNESLSETIKITQERLKIMLLIAKEKTLELN